MIVCVYLSYVYPDIEPKQSIPTAEIQATFDDFEYRIEAIEEQLLGDQNQLKQEENLKIQSHILKVTDIPLSEVSAFVKGS